MALNVASIADCPALPDRNATAKDVTDLRIDDIKVIGGLGDRYCVDNCKHWIISYVLNVYITSIS